MVKAKAGKVGRKRRVAGWALLTLGVLVAAVWVWSRWYSIGVGTRTRYVGASQGVVQVIINDAGGLVRSFHGWNARSLRSFGTEPSWVFGEPASQGSAVVEHVGLWLAWYVKRDLTSVGSPGVVIFYVNFALWPVPLVLWPAGVLLLRSAKRAKGRATAERCESCGYDRAGLAADVKCPECGKSVYV